MGKNVWWIPKRKQFSFWLDAIFLDSEKRLTQSSLQDLHTQIVNSRKLFDVISRFYVLQIFSLLKNWPIEEKKNDYSIAQAFQLYLRETKKKCGSHNIFSSLRWKNVYSGFRSLCNVQSCFAKKKKYIMVIGNHGCFYTKERNVCIM